MPVRKGHLNYMISIEIYFNQLKEKFDYKKMIIKESDLKKIILNLEKYDLNWLWTIVAFRKYLFSYIKWMSWSKEFKQSLIKTREYYELVNKINDFFL